MDSHRRLSTATRWVALGFVLVASGLGAPGAGQPATGPAAGPTGRTVTRLADGRWLLVGGQGAESTATLWDPTTEATIPLAGTLAEPRSWHTATLLADGSVLIAGGLAADGRVLGAPELFDPAVDAFQVLPELDLAPRAHHTATLLTDGRVLLVGGLGSAGTVAQDAELWDPLGSERVVFALPMPRRNHTATLLPDGRVLIAGGADDRGRRLDRTVVYDPSANRFALAELAVDSHAPAYLAEAIPANGATEVPVDVRVVLRFSSPLTLDSVGADTVQLVGPHGPVDLTRVPAESGRLLFLRPHMPLAHGETYHVELAGVTDATGAALFIPPLAFTTTAAAQRADTASVADEWTPDPTGRDRWQTGRGDSPWRSLSPLEAPAGTTALAGQVLDLHGRPLTNVTLRLGHEETGPDASGRFLLAPVEAGPAVLSVEAHTAGPSRRDYGMYEIQVEVAGGRTTVLPFTIWLSPIDRERAAPLATGATGRATTPRMPGLEIEIPTGVALRPPGGGRLTQLTMTPLPADRPPMPLPPGTRPMALFTLQTHGARVERLDGTESPGVRIVYPNTLALPPGARVDFWTYDAAGRGWLVYGQGTVTADTRRVEPDRGVRLRRVQCIQFASPAEAPGTGPTPDRGPRRGDPVDLGTGLFVYEKTDLVLPDVIPVVLTRTYRPNDATSRAFGIGTSHTYDSFLVGDPQESWADLILPDGGRVHYVRISGTSHLDSILEHTTSPTSFYKSILKWNALRGSWDITTRHGVIYEFGPVAQGVRLVGVRDATGNRLAIDRDGVKIRSISSPHGRVLEFTTDGANRVTSVRDGLGRTVSYTYDASGRLWKVTDPMGGVTEYTYDGAHRMLTIKDARGIVFLTNEYNANGRVFRQTHADNTTYQFAYTLDGNNQVTQAEVTDPRGIVERVTFNSTGYALSDTRAVGQPEQQAVTVTRQVGSNVPTSVTDALNRRTDFTYDSLGNLTSVTRLAGTAGAVTTTLTYEPIFNQVASVTDPLNHSTSFGYDTLGRPTTITDPLNHQTTVTYNTAGQPLTVTDPLNQTTQFGYVAGDLVSTTDPLGRVSHRFLDAAGRVLNTKDPLGRLMQYEWNAMNLMTRVTDALGGQTSFTYDANGNLLTLTDARNNSTTYTYNTMDRVATRTDPLQRQESYLYDNNGNLRQVTDRKNQVTTFSYDALDRQTFAGFGTTGTPPTYQSTIGYTYDAGDRLTQIVDSGAGTITRGYDLLDRLTSETTPEGAVSYTYDGANRRATMTVAGQTGVSYTFDNADRLTGITQGSANVTIAYDNADRRTSLTLPNGVVMEYGYDTDSRLTGITYKLGAQTLGTLTYTYDANGQRTAVGGTWARTNLPAALTSATYDNANQIATFGGTAFTYDANGNLTNDGTRTYTWNARDQLVAIAGPVAGSFGYDGSGRRRTKTVGATTTRFLYDGFNFVQELANDGTATANLLTGLGIDETFSRTDTTGTGTFLPDALGSILELADAAGALQTHYTYEPFGATTFSGTPSTNAQQFTARENDGTGLYAYRARFYSLTLQRFVSEDPLGLSAGINIYAYTQNQPTGFTDPLGLQTYNRSPVPIWSKPENGEEPFCVPPGTYDPRPIDGITSPYGSHPGEVYKNPTTTGVDIAPDGTVTTYFPGHNMDPRLPRFGPFPSWPIPVSLHPDYGWQPRREGLGPGWDPLFRKSRPEPLPSGGRKDPPTCPS